MCNPIIIIGAAMAVVGHHMEEQMKEAKRDHADDALFKERSGEIIRENEESIAAELERDKITRKARIARGQITTMAANRGTEASNSLVQAHAEFSQREGEYQSAVSAKRDQQLLGGLVRDSGRVSQWQGQMIANAPSGPLGYILAAGQGAMSGGAGQSGPESPDVGDVFDAAPQSLDYQAGFDVGPFQSAAPGTSWNNFAPSFG